MTDTTTLTTHDDTPSLQSGLRVGERVRYYATPYSQLRTDVGILVGAKIDGDGSLILLVRSQRNGGIRCLRPDSVRAIQSHHPHRRRARNSEAGR